MKIPRRKVLIGGVAIAALTATKSKAQGIPTAATGGGSVTRFQYGAFGGGGFVTNIHMSPDGLTRLIRTDVGTNNIYNATTNKWDILFTKNSTGLSGMSLGYGPSSYDLNSAPSLSSRIYAFSQPGFKGTVPLQTVMRSDDRGATFYSTACSGYLVEFGFDKFEGTKIAVDPANPDVVYWGINGGLIFRSIDGCITQGEEISALTDFLVTAKTTAAVPVGTSAYQFDKLPAWFGAQVNRTDFAWGYPFTYMYNRDFPRSYNNLNGQIQNRTATATTILANPATPNTRRIEIGERYVFASGPKIIFDPYGGTVTVGKQIRTKNIFICWSHGAETMVHSSDGGITWSAMPKGGPAGYFNATISEKGTIYGVSYDHPQYYSTNTPWQCWAYNTPRNPGSWTLFPITSESSYATVAYDYLSPGHVVFLASSGNMQTHSQYGDSGRWTSINWFDVATDGTDATWITNQRFMRYRFAIALGNAHFDPVTPNKLWIADGRGIFWSNPIYNSTPPSPPNYYIWHAKCFDNNEMIFQSLCKAPGHDLFGYFQDFGIVKFDRGQLRSPTKTQPSQYRDVYSTSIIQGNTVTYSLSEPKTLWATIAFSQITIPPGPAGNSQVWRSTDDGLNWLPTEAQPPMGYYTVIASASAANAVTVGSRIAGTGGKVAPAYYTNDGGRTFEPSTFNSPGIAAGDPFLGGIAPSFLMGSYLQNSHTLCCDYVKSGVYYAAMYSIVNGQTYKGPSDQGQIWQSSDGGATWNLKASGKLGGFPKGWLFPPATAAHLIAAPGSSGHLFYAGGVAGDSNGVYGVKLIRSIDGGASWSDNTNTLQCMCIAAGKEKPGRSYPTFYMFGTAVQRGVAGPIGVYRCDDATENPSIPMTWTLLSTAPAGELNGLNTMCGDLDVYGKFYFGVLGYIYGEIEDTK